MPIDIKVNIIITPLIISTENDQITPKGAKIISLTKKIKFLDLDINKKEKLKLFKET